MLLVSFALAQEPLPVEARGGLVGTQLISRADEGLIVLGPAEPEQVRSVLNARLSKLKKCLGAARPHLKFTIGTDGKVSDAKLKSKEPVAAKAEACALKQLNKLKFAAAKKPARVSYKVPK